MRCLQTGSFSPERSHEIHNSRRYSITWAASTVENLAKKYPRATKLACELWNVTHHDCAVFLSYNHPWWRIFRFTWKLWSPLEAQGLPTDGVPLPMARELVLHHLDGVWGGDFPDAMKKTWKKRLTGDENGVPIKEPV